MDSRFELVHHPAAAQDFQRSRQWFMKIDEDLADLFQADFRNVLRGIASGKSRSHVLASGESIRWVKLARFSHKVFFIQDGPACRLILGVLSGKRHPALIQQKLSRRNRRR